MTHDTANQRVIAGARAFHIRGSEHHVVERHCGWSMAYVLPRLLTKREVDNAIKTSEDRVLVLRFGRETDVVCRQMDDIVCKQNVCLVLPICFC